MNRSRTVSWNKIPDFLVLQCGSDPHGGDIVEIERELLPIWLNKYLKPLVGNLEFDLTIEYMCSGYYEPARIYGEPEDCNPECSDDERYLKNVVIRFKDDYEIPVPNEIGQKIFDHYEKRIKERELPDFDYYVYPDDNGHYDSDA
jgi:hypothetical protein